MAGSGGFGAGGCGQAPTAPWQMQAGQPGQQQAGQPGQAPYATQGQQQPYGVQGQVQPYGGYNQQPNFFNQMAQSGWHGIPYGQQQQAAPPPRYSVNPFSRGMPRYGAQQPYTPWGVG